MWADHLYENSSKSVAQPCAVSLLGTMNAKSSKYNISSQKTMSFPHIATFSLIGIMGSDGWETIQYAVDF